MPFALGVSISIAALIGGFMLDGGRVLALFQPLELLMIAGGAFGAFYSAAFPGRYRASLLHLRAALRGEHDSKALYAELLALLDELFRLARRHGLASLGDDSRGEALDTVLERYPLVHMDQQLREFITDALLLLTLASVASHHLRSVLQAAIAVHEAEQEAATRALTQLADALPAFGIIAAVLGVIHVMASIGSPASVLGAAIGAALVGTFLGVFLCYGLVSPMVERMHCRARSSSKALESVMLGLLATMHRYPPAVAVEFSRRALYASDRPSFEELKLELRDRR
jgi:chemotaxis protein MotA